MNGRHRVGARLSVFFGEALLVHLYMATQAKRRQVSRALLVATRPVRDRLTGSLLSAQ